LFGKKKVSGRESSGCCVLKAYLESKWAAPSWAQRQKPEVCANQRNIRTGAGYFWTMQ
jgi:hypothetical protein